MKTIKQFTCYVLLCMTALSAISCRQSEENNDIQTTASPSKETVQNDETDAANHRLLVPDGLPDKDFGGAIYTMYLRNDPSYSPDDFYAEASSGDIIEDAVYERNLKIAERFNVQFAYNYDESNTTRDSTALLAIRAGEDMNDILGLHGAYCFGYAINGYLLDWNSYMLYNDLSQPWWDQDFCSNMTVAGKLFGMTGSISFNSIGGTFCLLFNKNLFNTYDIPYPYQEVRDGTWSFDRFRTDALAIRADLNGNGVIEPETDQFGLYSSSWRFPIAAFYMAGDRVISSSKDGELELTLYNERTTDILDMMKNFYTESGIYITEYSGDYAEDLFRMGRAAFVGATIKSLQTYRDIDNEIGVVPYPKYDETINRYYSLVDAGDNVFAIPITVQKEKLEMISIITEALAAEGWKTVVPIFYEDALKTKFARDAESEEMLEIITASRYFDYGYFDINIHWNFSYIGRSMLNISKDFSSYYESQRKSAEKKLLKTYETYRDLDM